MGVQDAGLGGQVYDRESIMKGMGGMGGMPGMGGALCPPPLSSSDCNPKPYSLGSG